MNESAERSTNKSDELGSWGHDTAMESQPRNRVVVYGCLTLVVGVVGLLVTVVILNSSSPGNDTLQELIEERKKLDETTWADEVEAQAHEAAFVQLWDDLRAAEDKVAVLADFPFEKLMLGNANSTKMHD
ncbi:MAG: hypothetical protein IH991_23525, partial [Planctomycetes bacterium]|nr:hypothetical protein [Planctomycetota bacterium]